MSLADFITGLLADTVAEHAVDAVPYAQHLGLIASVQEGNLILRMPFKDDLIGSPQPRRLHGGVIGGLLETCGALTVARTLAQQRGTSALTIPKPVTITLDYLRAGAPEDSSAQAYITRMGRRIVNVRAEVWQSDRARLITTAHMNVLIG
jgi:uncharacterized protein (TIGR00369 family)